ncbi:hypothetical protein MBLNU457_1358t1 [Dothideomycetes sp. NU457]
MPFAQLVIGPPGSGKSTYCDGMQQFMTAIDRKCSVVNLDPANDKTNYSPALDIRDLVPLEEVMEKEELGPNGGVLYALEELEENWEWFQEELENLSDSYVIFDCPGQVELFTHHETLPRVFHKIEKLGYRLIVVQLLDSHTISRPTLYISSLLLCLRSMLHMPFPLINVLSKIDNLVKTAEPLPFNLDYYTEVQDLERLLPLLEKEQSTASNPSQIQSNNKFSALNAALIGLIEDFGLVGFEMLAVEDKTSMTNLLRAIDRASGYVFGTGEGSNEGIWQVAMQEGWGGKMDVRDVQERWIDRREEFDELERKAWEEEAREATATKVVRVPGENREQVPEEMQGMRGGARNNDDNDDDDLEELQRQFMEEKRKGDGASEIKVTNKRS